jgi:predicted DNA repair protein MutK
MASSLLALIDDIATILDALAGVVAGALVLPGVSGGQFLFKKFK